jgi:hypothetical protein
MPPATSARINRLVMTAVYCFGFWLFAPALIAPYLSGPGKIWLGYAAGLAGLAGAIAGVIGALRMAQTTQAKRQWRILAFVFAAWLLLNLLDLARHLT